MIWPARFVGKDEHGSSYPGVLMKSLDLQLSGGDRA